MSGKGREGQSKMVYDLSVIRRLVVHGNLDLMPWIPSIQPWPVASIAGWLVGGAWDNWQATRSSHTSDPTQLVKTTTWSRNIHLPVASTSWDGSRPSRASPTITSTPGVSPLLLTCHFKQTPVGFSTPVCQASRSVSPSVQCPVPSDAVGIWYSSGASGISQ